jgi:hypothetical protein
MRGEWERERQRERGGGGQTAGIIKQAETLFRDLAREEIERWQIGY